MKVSLQWLREFLSLEQSPSEIADLLTFAGIEVEGIVSTGVAIDKVVVGKILSSEQHPNADRLSVCRVEDGSGQPRQIVCGAKNYKVGDHVPVALPGAVLPGDFKIKVGKLRGETSEGMLCSAKELGISEDSAGLLILAAETIPGTPIGELYPSDTVFDLEITPNRPDLLSHRGIARELAAILGKQSGLEEQAKVDFSALFDYTPGNGLYRRQSRQDSARTLEDFFRSAVDVAGRSGGADAAQWLRAESESLLAWADKNGRRIAPESLIATVAGWEQLEGGNEHFVWRAGAIGRVVKRTRPPNFGARGDVASYVGNILAANGLFGDDIRLEGIVELPEGVSVVISQPFIRGEVASAEEIRLFMEENEFLPIAENTFRRGDGVLIADARPANILNSEGTIYPIDLHILNWKSRRQPLPIRLENSAACPWYSARVVRGVTVGPSPEWLRKRLQSIGLRSINNVVDVTNFVMHELGEPLHAFDLAKVDRGIVVRAAAEGEKFRALDGREYTLKPDDLLIADESRALAIAGVMGGEESGVTAETTDVVLESALFAGAGIRRTSRRLGLFSDASYRFERGVDPGILLRASDRACQLLEEVAGGTMDSHLAVAGELPELSWDVSLNPDRCRALLGVAISDERIDAILTNLGLEKIEEQLWRIPSFRGDLTGEVDLIEEVSRLHGMDAIPSQVQAVPAAISGADRLYDFQLRLKETLTARGFFEVRTLSLRPENATWEDAWRTDSSLRVRNPLTEDQAIFRESLLPGLLTVAETNQRQGAVTLRLLENGRVFRAGEREEIAMLGLLLSGDSGVADWRQPVRALDFFDLKATISGMLPLALDFRQTEQVALLLAADIFAGEMRLGWMGQILPDLVRRAGLKGAIFAAEIDLALLQEHTSATPKFQPLARFPAVTRDMALLAPATLTHGEIEATLLGAQEPLLEKVALFDVFADPTGEKIAAGQKSLAYSLTYRSSDRTLTQEEVNAAHARLKARLVEKHGVGFRE